MCLGSLPLADSGWEEALTPEDSALKGMGPVWLSVARMQSILGCHNGWGLPAFLGKDRGCNRPCNACGPILSLTVVNVLLNVDAGEDPVCSYLSPEPNSVLQIDS